MSNRIEETLRCPNDGRTIGRIEIRDSQRWLILPPAKDGHIRSLEKELREALEIHQRMESEYVRDFGPGWYQRVFHRIESELMDLRKVHPTREFSIPTDLDQGMYDLGKEVLPTHAPCPKCHTPWALRTSLIDGKFNGVLISDS